MGHLRQVGWMPKDELAEEMGVAPTDDEWLTSLEQIEEDGGLRPELRGRVRPVYVVEDD